MRRKRELGYLYQLIFKGDNRLDIEDECAKFKRLGFFAEIVENPQGGSHLKVIVGAWLLQIYGTGTANVFVMDKVDAYKVWRFLIGLGYNLNLEKVMPTRTQLWYVYDGSDDGKSSKEYPKCFKIVRALEVIVLKSLYQVARIADINMTCTSNSLSRKA
ncbi:MAG: hypothetical protein QXQ94_10730 [Candidatus Bathyarchaeia archaeon]